MEISAWAERLLTGETLADKLLDPQALTDEAPRLPGRLPAVPTRPAAWAFQRHRQPFPGRSALEQAQGRGRMLHFFANHELLAIEILALGLCSFPEAPPRFRRGLVQTIREEQRHFGLYLARMRALGVEEGEVPVNRFFWDSVAPVRAPMDLVLRLGLVFEQANLDHCLHYARLLRELGDEPTAAILDQVMEDEVGHVQHALHWFRQWKAPELSDWEAFAAGLALPLSPVRARGPVFDRPVRQRAGLDADFIDRLEVHGQSKGRPPTVWWWNPDVEAELARPDHRPTPEVQRLQRDLAALPWVLARAEDLVLVPGEPSLAWRRHVHEAGFPLPELAAQAGDRALGQLSPWGWSPSAEERLGPLRARQVAAARQPPPDPTAFRKDLAARLLSRWDPERAWLAGTPCQSWAEVQDAGERLRAQGLAPAVKPVLSTAGQGILRQLIEADVRLLLERQPCVLVVPWLVRELDLSLHLDLREGAGHLVGITLFEASPGGRWKRSLASPLDRVVSSELLRFLHAQHPRGLPGLGQDLGRFLGPELAALGVEGPVGVDMLVGRGREGQRVLHPLVELNPRWTMGRLALALRPRLAPGALGWLSIERCSTAALHPPGRDAQGRLQAGRLWLSDPVGAQVAAVLDLG